MPESPQHGQPEVTSAEGHCAQNKDDGQHCRHWWDGGPCCSCSAPAMTEAAQRALGMIE